MRSKSVLVLGAGGFVGRHLVKRLSSMKNIIINAVGHNTSKLPNFPGVYYHQTNIDNADLLNTLLPECTHIFHLAGASTPGASALHPVFEAEYNLIPTLRFLEILQKHPSPRLIYLSSGGAIYGNTGLNISIIQENTPPSPLSYYGAGKAALEQFVIALCHQQQRFGIILRPSNFYGPQQSHKEGFAIIPTIFRCINEKKPLQVWGNGENVRDYIFINDFIDLCVKLINFPTEFFHVKIYNVGTQKGISINNLIGLIEQIVEMPVWLEYQSSRSVDVKRVVLNCNKIYCDYGWKAHTSLLHGLKQTWQWFQKAGP